ncbi:MAG: pyridoxamine 5'-phosphate oxidase family protein [Haloarculaceae archaeon]
MSIEALTESGMRSMNDEEIGEFLTDQGVGTLALQGEDVPYQVPLSFGFDGESSIYFVYLLFGTESRKESLSDETSRGHFLVFDATSMHEWQSVSLAGDLTEIDDEEWSDLQETMKNAWHSDLFASADPMRGVTGYRFDIDEWTGVQYGVVE